LPKIDAGEAFGKTPSPHRKPPDSAGFSDGWRAPKGLGKLHRLLDIAWSLC
jgi:hypothetical protein